MWLVAKVVVTIIFSMYTKLKRCLHQFVQFVTFNRMIFTQFDYELNFRYSKRDFNSLLNHRYNNKCCRYHSTTCNQYRYTHIRLQQQLQRIEKKKVLESELNENVWHSSRIGRCGDLHFGYFNLQHKAIATCICCTSIIRSKRVDTDQLSSRDWILST